jgi:alkaline phosphatase D
MPRSNRSKFDPSRRRVVAGAGASIATLIAAPALVRRTAAQQPTWRSGDPFSLGVAAGTPRSDGFVLWTRLAPDPLAEDPGTPGGMSGGSASLTYLVASDPSMRRVVRRGDAVANPEFAYSLHVEVSGLEPGRPYWYQFLSKNASSRVGRAITLPSPGSPVKRLRFGFVSCANYEHGYFAAYRHLADDNPDLALFLGDYIYETIERRRPTVRKHSDGVECRTLAQYRNRYTQYQLDPDLQRFRAEVPAMITWDDHEVEDDYADRWSSSFQDPDQFLLRRAAAYQAFYENMPVRSSLSRPNGSAMRLYDRFTIGDLAEISMLDGRQYRSRPACHGPPNRGSGRAETFESCPELADPTRSMLGLEQEAWLFGGLEQSRARWNIMGQNVLMAQFQRRRADGYEGFWTDDWNGFPAGRSRLLRHINDARVPNAVVLGGDSHAFWANDLKLDFDEPRSPTVATEFVGTSISSHGLPYEPFKSKTAWYPHIHFFESRKRGYSLVDLDHQRLSISFKIISNAADPTTNVSTLRTFTVEDGRSGILPD